MYLDFYQLKKAPFHITPDPEFLFLSPSHKAALGSIIYGIEERQGFVAITGEVGLGKTTILRSYLERIDQRHLKTIYIFNANVAFRSLLKTIFREFNLDFEADDLFEMVNRLHQALVEEYKQGRNVALIIDEAQNMPVETLENLRMLSNLETATQKLVQIVLIGQPEFERKLELHELRQLKQRLVIRSVIAPLTAEESLAYMQHRLAKVALTPEPIFTKGALKRIADKARGTPRTLNILCTNALIAGFGYRQKPITARTTKEVIGEFEGKKKPLRYKRSLAWSAAVVVGAGVLWVSPYRAVVLSGFEKTGYVQSTIEKLRGIEHKPVEYPAKPRTAPPPPHASPLLEAVYSQGLSRTAAVDPADTNGTKDHSPAAGENRADRLDKQEAIAKDIPVKDASAHGSPLEREPQTGQVAAEQRVVLDTNTAGWPLVKVMQKGDYISRLAVEIYGSVNEAILEMIRKHNPQIKDLNKVEVGEKVLFPKLHVASEAPVR
jgi:general secretion pathway protein A